MSMVNLIAICVETLRIDNGCTLEKESIELIPMNLRIVFYLIMNQIDSHHDCI